MKARVVARCQACGAQTARWVGRCPECGEWGTVVEEPTATPRASAKLRDVVLEPLSSASDLDAGRVPTGSDEVDRVLGGGLVPGSVLLLGGEPGVGKSTLTLQVAASLASERDVLLVCGEESPQQIASRAGRLGGAPERVHTLADPSMPPVLAAIEKLGAGSVVVVDSVQTLYDPEIASAPGSVAQVRECGARIARAGRDAGVTIILVGHVTKDGSIAGPRVLEHLVDVVLTFDGDRQAGLRILRAAKNRFGSTQEVGFFDMSDAGLVPIRDASAYLLQDRCAGLAGSVLVAAVEGRRPLVLEIQALVNGNEVQMPRRTAIGVDAARLPLLLAVLDRRLGVKLNNRDVYVSAVGGVRLVEPATDLAVVLSVLSSWSDTALPDGLVAFGEVGLAGEVRQVIASDRRLAEARAVGATAAVVPANYSGPDAGLRLIRARRLHDVLPLVDGRAHVGHA